jgi:predicted membrane chloride channel (bestrophin family)
MDPNTHSSLPYFLRLRGSVLPKMIIPLLFVAGWATMVTCISKYVWNLGINSYVPPPSPEDLHLISRVLLIAIGFVVALALTFRSSTAYERYIDGIKFFPYRRVFDN